jgi:sugar phosphate isomerase/epimerase
MKMERIGLQLFTVRNHFATEAQARETFKKLAALGYSEAQTATCYDFEYDKFREMAEDAGIKIVGTHENFKKLTADVELVIENHKKLGVTNMGIGGFKPMCAKEVEDFIVEANKLAKRISKEGMKFTYHNHHQEFVTLDNGRRAMDMLIEGLDPENTSFVLDTHWVQRGGGDVCLWIEKLAGRIEILHLKDMTVYFDEEAKVQPLIAPVGQGNLPWEKILETADRCGVKYYCVEQDNCPDDFETDLKKSADYLKQFIK